MSFLDNNGLSYFYGKIKEKFVRSVNAKTPDSTGNIDITNVATADNLTSPDAQASYDYFIYRTSGGSASLESGEAQLVYVDGNVTISGRSPESFDIVTNNNIVATYNATQWKTYLSDPPSGRYFFNYSAPTIISTTISSSWTASGTWSFVPASGETESGINPSTYGIYVSNVINPSITITNNSSLTSVSVTPSTCFSAIQNSGTYNFIYTEGDQEQQLSDAWYLNGDVVDLTDYGIAGSGTAVIGDIIVINITKGTPTSAVRVDYAKYNPGTITVAQPAVFSATGFNHFDKATMSIQDATISNGKIAENTGTYVCYCRATPASNTGWGAYSASGAIRGIGFCATLPAKGTDVVTTGVDYTTTISTVPVTTDGYVVVVVTGMDDLMIHPRWSGAADDPTNAGYPAYVAYVAPDTITIPTQDKDGQSLPTATYGMPAVGPVADRLNLDAGLYIQRIGRLENNSTNMGYVATYGTSYDYDNSYIYYVLKDTDIETYEVTVDPVYIVNDWGTEEFTNTTVPVGAQTLYGQNLRDKLRTDVLTISEQNPALSTAQCEQVFKNLGWVIANTWSDT